MNENETIEDVARETVKSSLTAVERLLKKHHMLAEEDITWLMSESVGYIEFKPGTNSNRKICRAAKFYVVYDDDLEHSLTYAFTDLAIIVLRKKRREDR
ncbi:MAG: hypothetical protein ACTSSE_16670 [Candidatus Thorarchaeota archaeon]